MSRSPWIPPTYAAALAAVVLATAPAAAQRAIVRGQVVDTNNGQPVAHAVVHVGDEHTVAIADTAGRFELKRIRPGSRTIWADAPGYSMAMGTVELAANDEKDVTLELAGDPVRLATLAVTTNRFDRRARGYAGTARVYRQHDIAQMWYSNIKQLVESRARVRPTLCPGYSQFGLLSCTYSRGTAVQSSVFIDEVRWMDGLDRLADVQPSEVARVEVFGNGREIRVYTRQFMDWASKRPYVPTPLGLGF